MERHAQKKKLITTPISQLTLPNANAVSGRLQLSPVYVSLTYRHIPGADFLALLEFCQLLLVFLDSFPEDRHDPARLQRGLPLAQGLRRRTELVYLRQHRTPVSNKTTVQYIRQHGTRPVSESSTMGMEDGLRT